jgi:hypothetical protein
MRVGQPLYQLDRDRRRGEGSFHSRRRDRRGFGDGSGIARRRDRLGDGLPRSGLGLRPCRRNDDRAGAAGGKIAGAWSAVGAAGVAPE